MAFSSYSSAIAQTIRTVQHLDGIPLTYAFSAGGTYTPVSQEEAWIFELLAVPYGLLISPPDTGFGQGLFGEGLFSS